MEDLCNKVADLFYSKQQISDAEVAKILNSLTENEYDAYSENIGDAYFMKHASQSEKDYRTVLNWFFNNEDSPFGRNVDYGEKFYIDVYNKL